VEYLFFHLTKNVLGFFKYVTPINFHSRGITASPIITGSAMNVVIKWVRISSTSETVFLIRNQENMSH